MTNPLAVSRRAWDHVPLRARLVAILLVALVAALTLTGYGVQHVLRGYLVDLSENGVERTLRVEG